MNRIPVLFVVITSVSATVLRQPTTVTPWKVFNHSHVEIDYRVSDVPDNLPEHLTHLHLIQNNITNITKQSFSRLRHLKALKVCGPLRHIQPYSFSHLEKLEQLSLSRPRDKVNDRSVYPIDIVPETFYGLGNLVDLVLRAMNLTEIGADLFNYTRNLQSLTLSYNPISKIHEGAFKLLETLQTLDLSFTFITTLQQKTFKKLKNLKNLYIHPSRLTTVPIDALSSLKQLRTLRLGGCFENVGFQGTFRLTDVLIQAACTTKNFESHPHNITLDIGAFYKLATESLRLDDMIVNVRLKTRRLFSDDVQTLSLSDISLSDSSRLSPTDILSLAEYLPKRLTVLNMSHNRLTKIPNEAFTELLELRVLNLSYNAIRTIEMDAFYGLKNLEVLDLAVNQITRHAVQSLWVFHDSDYKLQVLNISANIPLTESVFREGPPINGVFIIPSLRELMLESMKLKSDNILVRQSLCTIPQLENLSLKRNLMSHFVPECPHRSSSLKYFDISYNPGYSLTHNHFASVLSQLEYADLSGNRFDLGVLKNTTQLQTLVLRNDEQSEKWDDRFNNDWQKIELRLFNLSTLVLTHSEITHFTQHVIDGIPNVISLVLHGNRFTVFDMSLFSRLKKLTHLDLSSNNIGAIVGNGDPMPHLKVLILSKNHLTSIPEISLGRKAFPALQMLDLSKNSLNCDCHLSAFRTWAQHDQFVRLVGFNQYMCSFASSADSKGIAVKDFDPSELICESLLHVYLAIGLPSVVLPLAIITGLCVYNRWYVKYACFLFRVKMKGYREIIDLDEITKKFDAFVSYNSADKDWVLRQLLGNLEPRNSPKFKICVDFKNFVPGKTIIDNIIDSIQESRKTILVLTPNFVKSEWCYFEMEMALHRLFDEGRDVVILVLLEPIPERDLPRMLRKLLTKKTYIEWPEDECPTARQLFWAKLEEALKVPSKVDRKYKI